MKKDLDLNNDKEYLMNKLKYLVDPVKITEIQK